METNRNWPYTLSKFSASIPVFIVLLCNLNDVVSGNSTNYAFLSYVLLLGWLGSEAINAFANRFHDPVEQSINRAVGQALPDVGSIEVRNGQEEIARDLCTLVSSAKHSIDIVTWRVFGDSSIDARTKRYLKSIEGVLTGNNSEVIVRRILWRKEHLDFLEKRNFIYGDKKNTEFCCWLPKKDDVTIPLMPCLIVDNAVVHFGLGYLGTPRKEEIAVTFKDPNIVGAFCRYFDYFWARSEYLKMHGEDLDRNAVNNARIELDNREFS